MFIKIAPLGSASPSVGGSKYDNHTKKLARPQEIGLAICIPAKSSY
jgi:hypothetical protein